MRKACFCLLMVCSFLLFDPGSPAGKLSARPLQTLAKPAGTGRSKGQAFHDLDKYRKNPEFDYREKAPEVSWLDRFASWLMRHLSRSSQKTFSSRWTVRIIQGICVIGLLFAVYKIFRLDKLGLFRKDDKRTGDISEDEKEFRETDFQKAIGEALAGGDFRTAVRLWYLLTLKELGTKALIDWSREKTNTAYLNEMRKSPLYPGFARLTYCFEYTFYGRFELAETAYRTIENDFREFNKALSRA